MTNLDELEAAISKMEDTEAPRGLSETIDRAIPGDIKDALRIILLAARPLIGEMRVRREADKRMREMVRPPMLILHDGSDADRADEHWIRLRNAVSEYVDKELSV